MNGLDRRDALRVLAATVAATMFLLWWPSFAAHARAATQAEEADGVAIVDVDTSSFPEVAITVDVAAAMLGGDRGVVVVEGGRSIPATVHSAGDARQEVAVVIDTSGSMAGAAIDAAKVAAGGFVAQLPSGSRVAVVGFGDRPYVVAAMTDDVAVAGAAVGGLQAQGETALYDALTMAVDQFSGAAVPRSVVLVSDGGDTASTATLEEATARLVGARVRLFGVQLTTAESNLAPLGELATATTGVVVEAGDAGALAAAYQSAAVVALRQARVTYRSQAAATTTVSVSFAAGPTSATADLVVPEVALPAAPAPQAPRNASAADDRGEGVRPAPLVIGGGTMFLALALLTGLALRRPPESLLAQERRRAESAAPRQASVLHVAKQRAGAVMERRMEPRGRRQALGVRLENAGIALRPGEYVVAVSASAAVAVVLGLALGGVMIAFLLAASTVVAGRAVVRSRTTKRRRGLEEQLSEMLQQLVSSLRAGYGVMQALDAVSREIDAPMCDELRRVVHEVQLGRELSEALQGMAERVGGQDFEWVVQAIEINREVGGDLVEVLEAVTNTIRAREHLQRQLKTLSAQGRLSARILLAMPFVMSAILSVLNPGYLGVLFARGMGLVLLGGVMMVVGWFWLRRIVRLEF